MKISFRGVPVLVALGIAASPPVPRAVEQSPESRGRVIVRALTNDGAPVTDLKKEEISIRTDNRERTIRDLEMVRIAGGAAAPASALPAVRAPFAVTPVGGSSGGREFLILLDEEGLAPGREEPARKALEQLIAAASPADRVGLLSLRIGGINMAPGSDHTAVTAAIRKIVGGGSPRESATDMACRTKRALDTLIAAFRGAPAGRTIVIVSTGAAPITTQRMATMQDQTTEVCQIRTNDMDQLREAAGSSAANLYALYYPDGLANNANISAAQQGFENIAGTTNGEFIRITGASEASIARIPRETSVYYLATLDDPAPSVVRRVDVRTTRQGIRIQARPVGAAAAASSKGMTPRDMLTKPSPFTEVPLRAAAFVSRHGASEMKVLTLFEPVDPATKLTAASVGLVDDKGVLKRQWTAKPEELQRSPIVAALPVAPGKYRVRAAATTATGGGTVDCELTAAFEEAPPLNMSTMLVGTAEKGFLPRLQFTSQDQQAVGLIELYNVPKGAKVGAKFEIAERETGPALGESAGTVAAGPGEDAQIVYGGFAVATLEPGDYVMRATITLDDKAVGKTIRTLRKVR